MLQVNPQKVFFWFAFFFFFPISPQDKQDYKNEGSDALRGTISNLPAAHSWALSHLKVLREICAPIYSFCKNVQNNNRPEMRNQALCYISLIWRRNCHLRGKITGSKLNGTQWLPLSLSIYMFRSLNLVILIHSEVLSMIFTHAKVNYSPPYESASFCSLRHTCLQSSSVSELQERAAIGQSREPVNWSCT